VGLLKDLAERPRPTDDLVQVSAQANGFSFPSGHVLGSVLLWGFLCYLAAKTIPHRGLRLGVQALCLSILVLTGLQRIYAGAHWPSDVLGGYAWGLALVLPAAAVRERLSGAT
jgi:undecaprenyl-diphosphatase